MVRRLHARRGGFVVVISGYWAQVKIRETIAVVGRGALRLGLAREATPRRGVYKKPDQL